MNDSLPSVPRVLGNVRANQNTSGSQIRPHHLTVLKTVMAMACPSTLREAVPVAVIGPSAVALALKGFNVVHGADGGQGASAPERRAARTGRAARFATGPDASDARRVRQGL